MAGIKVQNVNGVKPQHIREDSSVKTIASNIVQQVSASNREVVSAMSMLQETGRTSMMNSLDMKNVKLVDLILGRIATLLDEEFNQMKLSDIGQLKKELLQQMTNIQLNQLSKEDKSELLNSIASYFDKKINMKQLEMQLVDLNVTIDNVKQSLKNGGMSPQASADNASSYQSTLLAVNSAIDRLSITFSGITSSINAIIMNQQLVLDNISSMFNTLNQIYAIVDKIDTKQTWDMIQPYVQPIYKKIAKNVFGFIGFDTFAKQFEEEMQAIDTTSDFAKLHKHIDTAAFQAVEAVNGIGQIISGDSYEKYVYKPNAPQLRKLTQLESMLVMVKQIFTDKSDEQLTKEYLLGDEDSPLYENNKKMYDAVKQIEQKNKELNNNILKSQNLQFMIKKGNDKDQLNSERKAEQQSQTLKSVDQSVKKQHNIISVIAEKSKGIFSTISEFFSDMFSSLTGKNSSKDEKNTKKKERTVFDNISNFFKGLANIMDWAANGEKATVNMWEHFGIGGLPRIIQGIDAMLFGSDKDKQQIQKSIGSALNGILDSLQKFFNNESVGQLLNILKNTLTKDNLQIINNIMKSADGVFNSKMMNVIADKISDSSNDKPDEKSFLGGLSNKVQSFTKLSAIGASINDFFQSLMPVFGNEKGQFDKTKPMIDNIIKVMNEFPVEKAIQLVQQFNDNNGEIQKFIENIGDVKKKLNNALPSTKIDDMPIEKQLEKINVMLDSALPLIDKTLEITQSLNTFFDTLEIDENGNYVIIEKISNFADQFNKKHQTIDNLIQNCINIYKLFNENFTKEAEKAEEESSQFDIDSISQTIDDITNIINKIEDNDIFNKLQPICDFVDKNAYNIESTLNIVQHVMNLYAKYKDLFNQQQDKDSKQSFAQEAIDKINDFSKIFDAVEQTKIIDKFNKLSDTLFKEGSVLDKILEKDPQTGESIIFSKIDKILNLSEKIKSRFANSSNENNQNQELFSIDNMLKNVNSAIVLVSRVNKLLDVTEKTNVINRFKDFGEEIKKLLDVFNDIAGLFGSRGAKDTSKSSTSITDINQTIAGLTVFMMSINKFVSNFTKLVSDIQKLTSNGDTSLHTLAFFGKIVECVEKINSAIAYANESSVDVTNKIIDVINDATQKTVNILNECIKIVNKSIQAANKVGDSREDAFSNVKIEDYQLKKLDKPKTQAEIVPPKELLKNDIESNAAEYRSEYQELNNAKNEIAEEFQSSLKSFDDIARKLEDIYTLLEHIRVNMEDVNGELVNDDPKYNIKKIQEGIASLIALTASRQSTATSTNINE